MTLLTDSKAIIGVGPPINRRLTLARLMGPAFRRQYSYIMMRSSRGKPNKLALNGVFRLGWFEFISQLEPEKP